MAVASVLYLVVLLHAPVTVASSYGPMSGHGSPASSPRCATAPGAARHRRGLVSVSVQSAPPGVSPPAVRCSMYPSAKFDPAVASVE